MLKMGFRDQTMDSKQISEWFSWYKDGRMSVYKLSVLATINQYKAGKLPESSQCHSKINGEASDKDNIGGNDGISLEICHRIVPNYLSMWWVGVKLFPNSWMQRVTNSWSSIQCPSPLPGVTHKTLVNAALDWASQHHHGPQQWPLLTTQDKQTCDRIKWKNTQKIHIFWRANNVIRDYNNVKWFSNLNLLPLLFFTSVCCHFQPLHTTNVITKQFRTKCINGGLYCAREWPGTEIKVQDSLPVKPRWSLGPKALHISSLHSDLEVYIIYLLSYIKFSVICLWNGKVMYCFSFLITLYIVCHPCGLVIQFLFRVLHWVMEWWWGNAAF